MRYREHVRELFEVIKKSFFHPRTMKPWAICILIAFFHFLIPFDLFFDSGLKHKKDELQEAIYAFETQFNDTKQLLKLEKLNFNSISKNHLETLQQVDYTIQKYDKNTQELVFWSQKSIHLSPNQLTESKNKLILVNIYDERYLLITKEIGNFYIVGLFNLDNYLIKKWNRRISFFDKDKNLAEFNILSFSINKNHEFSFKSKNGNFLFDIQKIVKNSDLKILFSLILYLIEVILFLTGLSHFGKRICRKYSLIGIFIIITIVSYIRKLFLYFKFPSFLYSLKLFNPTLFSTEINPSLGDFLVFIFLTQYLILFINKNFHFDSSLFTKYKVGFLVHTFVLFFFLGESFSMTKILERLVLDSNIWFNFNYFPRITIYSLIGLTVMLMSSSNYYILMKLSINAIVKIPIRAKMRLLSFSLILLLLIIVSVLSLFKPEIHTISFILFFFMSIVYWRIYKENRNKYLSIFIFILFASTTTTYLLHHNNNKREELILSALADNVEFGIDKEIKKNIINYINCISNFRTDLCVDSNFNAKIAFRSINYLEYQENLNNIIKNNTDSNSIIYSNSKCQLYLVNDINNKKYIAEINVNNTPTYLEFTPNNYIYKISNNTPKKINNFIIGENNINYALYINDSLKEFTGQYPYQLYFKYKCNGSKIMENKENMYFSNFIYTYSDNIKVLITTYIRKPVSNFTLLAYIFSFNLILFFIYQLMIFSLKIIDFKSFKINKINSFSLSEKIMIMILLLIVSIFLSIAFLSYNNLKTKSDEYNKEYLTNKLNSIQFSLQSFINSEEYKKDNTKIFSFINQLSKYNNIDILLYNKGGKLLSYSEDNNLDNFNKQSELDPLSYWTINNENTRYLKNYTENEKMLEASTLTFPFNTIENYIITIPLTSNNKMKSDISNFTVALLNLYIFLFFISLILSIWLANNITSPLKQLTEKITKIKFSSKNEYLDYKHNDEIGELVKKYNTMVDEIEYSAKQLAFNEREEAWREMAMQIAHEIKNPLTPMKLKIQYLQRKIKDNAEGIEDLTLKVSETLIEQINNLDMIATSFSNFARMNEPKIEVVDLLLLTKNVTSIFDNKTTEQVVFTSTLKEAIVTCDHTQMVSCLNNLIKNAFQALSENEIKTVYVNLFEEKNNFILEVKDYGIGMTESVIEKIFTPKFTTKSSGSGLGLSITKKFLESIGASISVHSKLKEFTIFTITISKYDAPKQ